LEEAYNPSWRLDGITRQPGSFVKNQITETQWKHRRNRWIEAQKTRAERSYEGNGLHASTANHPTPFLKHLRSLITKELKSRKGTKCKYDKGFLWNDRFEIIPDKQENKYLTAARKQHHKNPTLDNYRIYWLAWKNAEYPGHDESDCHGPECATNAGHGYDGPYMFCNKHNEELYSDFCRGPDKEEKQKALFNTWCEKQ